MMLGLLAVLPSALNIPQSNPAETLEYAPVPPEDQNQPPPAAGNFASLGLGSSAGLATQSGEADLPAGGAAGGRTIKTASTKRCVGSPPRQTEDPLSPPCVGYFEGDNGGETYQGVTREEVRVLVIVDGFNSTGNYKGDEETPERQYYDLSQPGKEEDHSQTRYLRAWQQYFNERYQTYGRFVHFWAYYPSEETNAEARRADAADNYAKVKPFAVVWPHPAPNVLAYNEVMANKGVLSFSGLSALRAELFQEHPGLVWGYLPSLEEHAVSFSAFVCEKVAPHPVEFSGNPDENGRPRKYGLIYSVATGQEYAKEFVDMVRPRISRCGVTFALERQHEFSGARIDTRTGPEYAAEAMAAFREEGITTIMWMFGYETNYSKSAAGINYRPEWILAGDGTSEGVFNGQGQEQSVWDRHAVSFTLHTKTLFGGVSPPCRDAYLQVDPTIPRGTLDFTHACFYYDELRQLFTGIQVAGSKLNRQTMDKGYHAIPAVPSKDPTVPACYYGPGDYTCVKDGTVLWYDGEYQDENNGGTAGCWRLVDGGQRYIPEGWPSGNLLAQRKDSDPCNGHLGTLHLG